jgi:hypothetical protein
MLTIITCRSRFSTSIPSEYICDNAQNAEMESRDIGGEGVNFVLMQSNTLLIEPSDALCWQTTQPYRTTFIHMTLTKVLRQKVNFGSVFVLYSHDVTSTCALVVTTIRHMTDPKPLRNGCSFKTGSAHSFYLRPASARVYVRCSTPLRQWACKPFAIVLPSQSS